MNGDSSGFDITELTTFSIFFFAIIQDRYKSFSGMMREWRHLKMAKHSGRGNDSERTLSETRTGEMGIPCIACPRPGVNLPNNWQDAPKSERCVLLSPWLNVA